MRIVLPCALACLAATDALAAAPMVPTNVPGAFAFPAPPPQFDPIGASDEALREYGFPPRPNPFIHRKRYAAWAQIVRAARRPVMPVLEPLAVQHVPMVPRSGGFNGATAGESNNWSGEVMTTSATSFGSSSFYALWVQFNVPIGEQAFGVCSGSDYESTWIGMDGDAGFSSDVIQAGTESDAYCSQGTTVPNYYAWYEWYPATGYKIANFPVSPGDDIGLEVAASSTTEGAFFLTNETTNQYVAMQFGAPAGTSFIGNSAEWIVERPKVGANLTTLANYVTQFMYNTVALLDPSHPVGIWPGNGAPGVPVTDLTMYEGNNAVSAPTSVGWAGLEVQDEGPAK